MFQKTLERLSELPELGEKLNDLQDGDEIICSITTGFDGAGSQVTANQKTRNEFEQSHRESAHICIRELKKQDGTILFDNPHKNSCHGMRPWLQIPVKENRESLNMIHQDFMNDEIQKVKDSRSCIVLPCGKRIYVKHVVQPWLVDGKAIKEVTGMGGAFCTKCKCSKKEAHDVQTVSCGFELNRDMSEVASQAAALCDDVSGDISR